MTRQSKTDSSAAPVGRGNTFSIAGISPDARSWIKDLAACANESAFPDIDPEQMTEDERDILCDYLAGDDGSLSHAALEFSREVADELRAAPASEVEDE